MRESELIQIAILAVLTATLIAIVIQMLTQNKILKAQLLRDCFGMYWRLFEPLSSGQEDWMEAFPDDYMDPELYEAKYRGKRDAQTRYIGMSQIYEYLAFTHGLERLGLPDPLGRNWTGVWLRSLVGHEEFMDVHRSYTESYPEFARVVEDMVNEGPPRERGSRRRIFGRWFE